MKLTPLLAGCLLLLLFSCQREPNVTLDPTAPPPSADSIPPGSQSGGQTDYYYTAIIDGTTYKETVTDANGFIPGSGTAGTDDISLSASIDPPSPRPANSTSLEVDKGIMHHFLSSTDAEFRKFFAPGSYPYTTGPDGNPFNDGTTDGIYIYWTDKNGELWSTMYGSGKQTGSTFKIISTTDDVDIAGRLYLKVKMQFSCTLYNKDGQQKSLKNGELVGDFGPK